MSVEVYNNLMRQSHRLEEQIKTVDERLEQFHKSLNALPFLSRMWLDVSKDGIVLSLRLTFARCNNEGSWTVEVAHTDSFFNATGTALDKPKPVSELSMLCQFLVLSMEDEIFKEIADRFDAIAQRIEEPE